MVYPDQFSTDSKLKGAQKTSLYIPSTVQRVIAFVIDLLIFGPVISFLLFGLFSKVKFYSLVVSGSPEVNDIYFLYSFAYFLLWILFQTLFSYFYQATPGQYFLKMEIKKMDGTQPQFIHLFFRHLFFPFHIFTFGLSLLERFFNPNCLCFHDKVSETQMITTVVQEKEELKDFEKRFLISWFQSGLVLLLIVCSLFVFVKYKSIAHLKQSRAQFYKNFPECQAQLIFQFERESKLSLSEAKRDYSVWKNQLKFDDHFYYFLTQNKNSTCLKREADLALYAPSSETHERALAYVAKAFSAEDLHLDKQYLQLACEQEASLCYLQNDDSENVSYENKMTSSYRKLSDAEKYILFTRARTNAEYSFALQVAASIQNKNDFLFKERVYTFELWRQSDELNQLKSSLALSRTTGSKAKTQAARGLASVQNEQIGEAKPIAAKASFEKLYSDFLKEEVR